MGKTKATALVFENYPLQIEEVENEVEKAAKEAGISVGGADQKPFEDFRNAYLTERLGEHKEVFAQGPVTYDTPVTAENVNQVKTHEMVLTVLSELRSLATDFREAISLMQEIGAKAEGHSGKVNDLLKEFVEGFSALETRVVGLAGPISHVVVSGMATEVKEKGAGHEQYPQHSPGSTY